MEYARIIYPERAEYLNENKFSDYKIFLDHWREITTKLKSNYEESHLRRVSKSLFIYGEQSTGKTLLAKKLAKDFQKTYDKLPNVDYDDKNMWHRLVSGFGRSTSLIAENTPLTAVLHIEDQPNWIESAKTFCGSNTNRTCIIIADNCERDYFVQGILGIDDRDFLQIGRTDALIRSASQKFVALCRSELRGAMIILFTNDDIFALTFEEAVNQQHSGLVEIAHLPLPSAGDKEAIVRINTNRLNPFSYWYCLDRAGIDEKKRVYSSFHSKTGFKDSFESVDMAIQRATPSRVGRPPRKCLLSLFVMTNSNDVSSLINSLGFTNAEPNINAHMLLDIQTVKSGWAGRLGLTNREASLLESEWNFRIIVAGNQFVSTLLLSSPSSFQIKNIIDLSLTHHGPGTRQDTLSAYRDSMDSLLNHLATLPPGDNTTFWAAGQIRAHDYERKLRIFYPNYNTSTPGFLQYRPDLTLESYSPCHITSSTSDSDEHINDKIRRHALVCEFTASKEFSLLALQSYMSRKLPNYVEILQEQ